MLDMRRTMTLVDVLRGVHDGDVWERLLTATLDAQDPRVRWTEGEPSPACPQPIPLSCMSSAGAVVELLPPRWDSEPRLHGVQCARYRDAIEGCPSRLGAGLQCLKAWGASRCAYVGLRPADVPTGTARADRWPMFMVGELPGNMLAGFAAVCEGREDGQGCVSS